MEIFKKKLKEKAELAKMEAEAKAKKKRGPRAIQLLRERIACMRVLQQGGCLGHDAGPVSV